MEIPFWLPKIEILAKISFKGKAIVSLPLSPCASSWWFRFLRVLTSFSSKDSCLCDSRLLQRCPHAIWKRVSFVYFLFLFVFIKMNRKSCSTFWKSRFRYILFFQLIILTCLEFLASQEYLRKSLLPLENDKCCLKFEFLWKTNNSLIYRGIQTGHSACRHSSGRRY